MGTAFGGVEAVDIQGLRELRKELKSIDAALPKELRKAGKQVADALVPPAKAAARALGRGPAERLAPTIRAGATQTAAFLRFGGPKYPDAAGWEFGSDRFKQFWRGRGPNWRGNQEEAGHAIFPTIRERQAGLRATAERSFGDLIERISA